jgi:hypothetical protein
VSEVIAIRLDGSEGDTTETVNFENALRSATVCDHDNIRFFAHTDLVANRVDDFLFLVRIQRQVVETAVSEPIAIVCRCNRRISRL